MRGLVRQKQKVYWSRISEKTQGLDRIKVYEKPVLYSFPYHPLLERRKKLQPE